MFFDSIVGGIGILAHWRFWAVVVGAGALGFAPFIIIGILTSRSEAASTGAGCLMAPVMMIWAPILLTVSLILLAPLMIAGRNEISFGFLALFSYWDIAKIVFSGLVAMFIVGIIPVVGSIGTLPLFAQSATVLGTIVLFATQGRATVWPGIFNGLGLAIVGGFVAVVIFYIVMIPFAALIRDRDEAGISLLAQPLGMIPAIVPVCFYAGWLREANAL